MTVMFPFVSSSLALTTCLPARMVVLPRLLHDRAERNGGSSAGLAQIRRLHEGQCFQGFPGVDRNHTGFEKLGDLLQEPSVTLHLSPGMENALGSVDGDRKIVESAAEPAHYAQPPVLPFADHHVFVAGSLHADRF